MADIALIRAFVAESNRIEGITREPTDAEVKATVEFLGIDPPAVIGLANLVSAYAPGSGLRDQPGMNVRVGRYVAPPGGPDMYDDLDAILGRSAMPHADPWCIHCQYEVLHPFTDGNGRSGRALWAWMMVREHGDGGLALGFLHRFYYQTLERYRA